MSAIEHSTVDANDEYPAIAVVVIALSAGGLVPLRRLIRALPSVFPAAIVIAQHIRGVTLLPEILFHDTLMPVALAECGTVLRPGRIYVCPSQKHVIVNPDGTLSLSSRDPVRFFRPNADWLFESAAASFGERTFAIVLSGVQNDGARATRAVRAAGGAVLVQSPDTCDRPEMPLAAIATGSVDYVLDADDLAPMLQRLLKGVDLLRCRAAWENPFLVA